MPYRIDVASPPPNALDVLVELGALDIESRDGGLAAIMPDGVMRETLIDALGGTDVAVSAAVARDNGSIWLLSPGSIRIGDLLIAPPEGSASPNTLKLADSQAFGTGHHPTTALCIEAIEEFLAHEQFDCILDVGTGSGILALTALILGVPQAVGLDIDDAALEAAAANARVNHLENRFRLIRGGADAVSGTWPLVVANVLAAPLIEMAPFLVRRVGRRGRLLLSGIPSSLEFEVRETYQNLGMRYIGSKNNAGWALVTLQASW